MRFSKYHGTGNDFVMIEDLAGTFRPTSASVSAICDRHLGVGADGIIRITRSESADFFMDYWNADGQVAEMCGNGIRCLGKLVYDRGLTERTAIDVDTRDGVKHLELVVRDGAVERVRVDMGTPVFARGALPMAGPAEEEFVDEPFTVEDLKFRATAVSMGNPHMVLIGETDPAEIDVRRVGPVLEHGAEFPERTNVEFVRIEDGAARVRVWERGVGETMACGTGGCATLVAAARLGLVPRRAPVIFPGGELIVDWVEDDRVFLEGPATFVFDGELDDTWVREVSR